MAQKYTNLVQEMQVCKKDLQMYKNRCNSLQADNQILQQSNKSLNKKNKSLTQQLQSNSYRIKNLERQRQQLLKNYNENVGSIKMEIQRKQQQLHKMQGNNAFSNGINNNWLRKQIQIEIQNKYAQQLQNKENKQNALERRVQQMSRQREIDKEKYQLRIKTMQQNIQQLQQHKLTQIKEYADRTYKESNNKYFHSDENMMKKMRKELDELRNMLSAKNTQIQSLLDQKNLLHKQMNNNVLQFKKQSQRLMQQMHTHKRQNQTMKHIQSTKVIDNGNSMIVKDKEREIKKLKMEIEDKEQLIDRKERKISQLQVHNAQVEKEIQIVKRKHHQQQKETKYMHQQQKQQLVNKIRDVKVQQQQHISTNQRHVTNDNYNHHHNHSHMADSRVNTVNVQNQQQYHQTNKKNVINEVNVFQKRTLHQQNIQDQKSLTYNNQINIDKNNRVHEEEKERMKQSYEGKVEKEKQKVKEIARKYIQVKKRNQKLQNKLKEANQKVVQLLKTKIQLGSPKHNSKKQFNFDNLPNNQNHLHPHMKSGKLGNSKQKIESMNSLNKEFYEKSKQFVSPHRKQQMSTASKEKQSKTKQYYEKALKYRNRQNSKNLKCLNHSEEEPQYQ